MVGYSSVAVLRVVEQEVGVVRDLVAADPVGGLVVERDADRRLVVRDVREHLAVLLDAVPDRRALMDDVRGVHRRRADRHVVRLVVEHESGRDVGEVHREQRRRQVDRDALLEALHR